MNAYKISKQSELSMEEKIKIINECDIDELLSIVREHEDSPRNYDKDIIIQVYNKLFENGITCI